MEKSLKSRPSKRKKQEKVARDMKNTYKVAREMEKTHIFRIAVLANMLCFFDKMFMIRVAMGAVKIRIDPEASPFRGDAYFEGPGAQKNRFLNTRTFLNIFFKHIFRKKLFSGYIVLEKIVSGKMGLVSPFWVGGQA